jgi:ferric-dicitrate binding protein FerR (iron transport regulator)
MQPTEHIVFYRELTASHRDALQDILACDPVARRNFRRWHAAREAIARELKAAMVERELFGSFVLLENGRSDLLSAAERARVESAAPAIRRALQRHAGLASVAQDLRADAEAFERMWDERFKSGSPRDSYGGRFDRIPARRNRTARRGSGAGRWLMRAGIGATLAVFLVLLLVLVRRDGASVTIATVPGEVRVVEIGDGSSVRMLGGSRLTYVRPEDTSALDRRADFEGSAFFDIAAADQGFVLHTPNAQAVVLGTSFGIRTDAGGTEIVLAEGSLALSARSSPEQAVVLAPGQMSRVVASGTPSTPEDVRVHDHLAWTGLFVFRAVTLDAILVELSRSYQREVSAEEALLGEPLTGRFERDQELSEILEILSAAIGAQVERSDDDGFRLSTP